MTYAVGHPLETFADQPRSSLSRTSASFRSCRKATDLNMFATKVDLADFMDTVIRLTGGNP
jgi:hypothetical protein